MTQAANRDIPNPAIDFISALFGENTEQPIFFQTLANDPGDESEANNKKSLLTRDVAPIVKFIGTHDRNRRGMFFCVATLAKGSPTRNKETVCETVGLHADIDFKGVVEDEPQIRRQILTLPCQPTVIVRSGGGLHLYWLFKESLNTQEYKEILELILKRLADIVAGDPAVCEVARLMRLPGTHNSKYGDMREVVCERLDGPRYELDELEEWMGEQQPVLTRKPPEPKPGRKAEPVDDNPFMAHARQFGYKPRLNVAERLAAIGEGKIHTTLRDVAASLVHAGQPSEEVVGILMEAARAVGGPDWNWRVEEVKIRDLCASALKKFPPKEPLSPADPAEDPPAADPPPDDEKIADIGEARTKRKPKMKATAVHIVLAEAVLAVIRQRGEDLMFTNTGDYRHRDGLWRLEDRAEVISQLNSALEEGAQSLKMETTNRLISEARNYILRLPELQGRDIQFDQHGCIPTRSGLVDPITGHIIPPNPGQYATWRIECDYNPGAACPFWLKMLEEVFADRSPEARALHIQLLQEILGTGLVDVKPKAISKAVIFVGGSNYGKSGLIDVMAGLFGRRRNTTSFEALERPHGTMPFAHRVPWVLHEAFDAGKWHLSSTVKEIISGEGVQINVKGGKIFWQEVAIPIFWGSNTPPQFKEATDAIINRIVVVECRRKFDENILVGTALEASQRKFEKPQHLVLATEMEGLLAWAIEGLKRVKERGYFILPEDSKAAAENVKIDSNLVAGFLRDCVELDSIKMISTADFSAAFASWWLENKGEGQTIPRSEMLGRAIRAYGDPRIAFDRSELRTNHKRYYAGIRLNPEGRRHWNNTVTSNAFVFQGRTTNTSDAAEGPEHIIPGEWDGKPVIQAMRAAYEKMRDRTHDHLVTGGHPKNGGHDDIPF